MQTASIPGNRPGGIPLAGPAPTIFANLTFVGASGPITPGEVAWATTSGITLTPPSPPANPLPITVINGSAGTIDIGAAVVVPGITANPTPLAADEWMTIVWWDDAWYAIGYSGSGGGGGGLPSGTQGQVLVLPSAGSSAAEFTNGIIDARAYGVKADNSTDDTAAINAALQAAIVPISGFSGTSLPARIVQLPAGRIVTSGQILMPSNVILQGHGPSATQLLQGLTSENFIVLQTGTEVQVTVRDLGVIQSGTPSSGSAIAFINSSETSILGDARHIIENVVIVGTANGIYTQTNTEVRVINCSVYRTPGYGYFLNGTDEYIWGSTAGACGATSFFLAGANSRLFGCKAFGQTALSNGAFFVDGSGRHEVTCCEAQDNFSYGFNFSGTYGSNLTDCIADSNAYDGFSISDGSTVTGCSTIYRSGGAHVPRSGVAIGGTGFVTGFNAVDESGSNPFPLYAIFGSGPTGPSALVSAPEVASESIAYAASITPDPYRKAGTSFLGTITGNLTVANPATPPSGNGAYFPGVQVSFVMPVDGTGGYTLAFGTAYKIDGSAPALAANTTVQIAFRFDGTYWRETQRSIT